MKKLLWFWIFLMTTAITPAHADVFQWTDYFAADFSRDAEDQPNYTASNTKYAVGGPSWSDTRGWAAQFLLSQATNISDLMVDATINPSVPGAETSFVYMIFAGSSFKPGSARPIPDISNLVLTTTPLTFTNPSVDFAQSNGNKVDVNYDFQPGEYWLAARGSGGVIVHSSEYYIDPPIDDSQRMAAVAAPEPSSFLLFLVGGACFAAFRFRRGFATT